MIPKADTGSILANSWGSVVTWSDTGKVDQLNSESESSGACI